MRKQVEDALAADPKEDHVQERGQRAASLILAGVEGEKLEDPGWDLRCQEFDRFVGGLFGFSEDTLREEIARLRAIRVITPGGARLARKLYDGAKKEDGRAGRAEG